MKWEENVVCDRRFIEEEEKDVNEMKCSFDMQIRDFTAYFYTLSSDIQFAR